MTQASPLATPELFKAPRHQLPALPWPIITCSQSLLVCSRRLQAALKEPYFKQGSNSGPLNRNNSEQL
ncbi:hypothetical protein SRHO_G00041040 [Serrasalmus rhombeus]